MKNNREPSKNETNRSAGAKATGGSVLFRDRKRTYELLFPIVIVLVFTAAAFAMGKRMKVVSTPDKDTPAKVRTSATAVRAPLSTIKTEAGPKSVRVPDKTVSGGNFAVSRTLPNEVISNKVYFKNNWNKYFTFTHSDYKRRFLGGIKGLSVTFTNNTDYAVDHVVAAITYIKANHKSWETQSISLVNIAPHSARHLKINKVKRGKWVSISVRKIVSANLGLYYEQP